MNGLLICILLIIFLHFAIEYTLACINENYTAAHRTHIPENLKKVMDFETYQKSINYTLVKSKFHRTESIIETLFALTIIGSGAVPLLLTLFTQTFGHSLWHQALSVLCVQILFSLPFLPFQWIQQFKIEASYGFNRSTQKLWWIDRLKGFVLMLLIGTPILAGIIAFYQNFENSWWLMAATALILFQIIFMLIYPKFILPLFNKLTPLPEGDLKNKLMTLANTAGFQAKSIEVMDGSKRSSHSNAFFTGFGRFRRIIFYDTLLEQLTPDQIEAVLAHEIGHYKKGHILKHLALSTLLTFIGFYAMHYGLQNKNLFTALGFQITDTHLWLTGLLIMGNWLISPIIFCIQPFMTYLSRRHEYEADAFAKKAIHSPEPLIEALYTLSQKNLSNLVPHPVYSRIYYSHPTLIERETALRKD